MQNSRKKVMLLILVLILCIVPTLVLSFLYYIGENNQELTIAWTLNRRDTPFQISIAFATALRLNHNDIYDMTNPELWPRLDKWMSEHEAKICKRQIFSPMAGSAGVNWDVTISCFLRDGGIYTLRIQDIIIRDQQVVDWGNVDEQLE